MLFPQIKLGYVSLNDAAPFIVAKEFGIFENYGLDVKLSREIGWATIRDKIEYGELDAAQALAPMPFAASLGIGIREPMECVVSLVTSVNGNAITMARALGDSAESCVEKLKSGDFRNRTFEKPTLAVVSLHSSHYFLLRMWLMQQGIQPDKQIHFVVLPPDQMPYAMESGYIDGFCAGEPWNSMAEHLNAGKIVATSLDVCPGHVEKVLLVSHSFAFRRIETHTRLVAALLDACALCQQEIKFSELAELMHRVGSIDCPVHVIERGLAGFHVEKKSNRMQMASDFLRFDENRPTARHAEWILSNFRDAGMISSTREEFHKIRANVFAEEFFEEADKIRKKPSATNTKERTLTTEL